MQAEVEKEVLLTGSIVPRDPLQAELTANVVVDAKPVNLRAERVEDGILLTVTDVRGTTTAMLRDLVGPQGPKGDPGNDGKMTFDDLTPAQKESLKGDQGEPGPQGIPGPPGEKGEQGIPGIQGEQGIQGVQGIPGEQGIPGTPGAKGDPGYTPIKGTDYFTDADVSAIKTDVANDVRLTFTNKSVAVSAWASNTTYADFPFRAAVACAGVTANHVPFVNFNAAEAASGDFCPAAQSYSSGVYIYAASKPTETITIPSIVCIK